MNVRNRFTTILCVVGFLSAGIFARAAYVQLVGDPRLDRMARRQFNSRLLVRPERGGIADRNGEPLAINTGVLSLAANPSKIKKPKAIARLLSKAIGVSESKFASRLADKKEFIWIKRHLTDSEIQRLEKWKIKDHDGVIEDGLILVKESRRVYPHGDSASHVLGSVNLDSEGIEGMELWGESHLQGKVVSITAIKDALGRPAFIDASAARSEENGLPIQLTLDTQLQYAVEQELRAAVEAHGAKGGSVIVMDASNGEILALANEPHFNPNIPGAPQANRRNRAITDGYEPGSTLKPIVVASALARGMKISDRIHGELGSIVIQGKRISEAEAHERFEWLTLGKMIQVSSNVVAAKLALKLGPDVLLNSLKTFGFGSKTQISFPGEISGILPPRKRMQPLTTANIGFGHGLLVTPLQMVRAYAAFANGGYLVQPTLLKSPQVLKGRGAPSIRSIFSPKIADEVSSALEGVVSVEGTGRKAAVDGYRIAGKTGTAQVVDPDTGKYSKNKYIASFVGYLVGTQKRLVFFTSVVEPRGVYYAGETAAPLFKRVVQAAVHRLSIPPTESVGLPEPARRANPPLSLQERVERATVSQAVPMKEQIFQEVERVVLEPITGELSQGESSIWKMPDLKGMTAVEALAVFGGRPVEVEIRGTGLVVLQNPPPGQQLREGDKVSLRMKDSP